MSTQPFSINDTGEILFQAQANNPLPGEPVAMLTRGEHYLRPNLNLLEKSKELIGEEAEALTKIHQWFDGYMQETIGLLMQLKDPNLSGASQKICESLYEAMGVMPRAELEKDIKGLDEQGRAQLRFKKVKLGPILVFLPLLNKPAAVRLRAVLWGLWYQKGLPVTIPADGIVSQPIEGVDVNPHLYQTIGFPIFGPRAVRIDMLDRVVVDLYEQSKDWKFQARHKYCEWLGCTIEDLYLILEAMGHQKIEGAAPAIQTEEENKDKAEKAKESEEKPEAEAEKKTEQVLPELAWFNLKRDRKESVSRKPRKQANADKRPKNKKSMKPKGPRQPKSMSFQIKGDQEASDSPFSVLQKLKKDA